MYSLSYLMRGRLPWERLELEGAAAVLAAKRKAGVAELSQGLPPAKANPNPNPNPDPNHNPNPDPDPDPNPNPNPNP